MTIMVLAFNTSKYCADKIYTHFTDYFDFIDQISIEELDIIYKIPHTVPISAHHKWNYDDLLEKMWEYLQLVRM
jgi:ribosome-interacting GTPase 1